MNWIENFVRPKLQALVQSNHNDSAENKWSACPNCNAMLFKADLPTSMYTCSQCQHHLRMPAQARIAHLFDEGYTMLSEPDVAEDPLSFRDMKRYTERLKTTRATVGVKDVVQSAHGTIKGTPAVAAVFDFRFMGGSMGSAAGAALVQATEKALAEKCGLIVFTASGGARMQEGILSLMQLPRSIIAVEMLQQAALPYIVVLCDPTTGGVSASFAMLGDIHIAEPGATIGFAGRRVIEQTVRETLPEGFQQAEQLVEKGVIDVIMPRTEQPERLSTLLKIMQNQKGKKNNTRKPESKTDDDSILEVADPPEASA